MHTADKYFVNTQLCFAIIVVKMATYGCSAFSNDGQYLANCTIDGRLKVWETATNRLKIEYVPDQHLKSPCSVVKWITVSLQSLSITVSHVVFSFLSTEIFSNIP